MKKNWMKLLSLLLSVVMVLCLFAACGSSDDDDDEGKSSKKTIVGEWEAEWDLADLYNQTIEASGDAAMAEYLSVDELNIVMCFEFDEDGNYKFYVDEAALEKTFEDLKEQMVDGMKAYFEEVMGDALAATGMSLEDVLSAQGMTLEGLVEESLDMDALFDPDDLSESGIYKFEDGKLYTAAEGEEFDEEDYALCELKGDKLTLDAPEDMEMDSMLADLLPLNFERQ